MTISETLFLSLDILGEQTFELYHNLSNLLLEFNVSYFPRDSEVFFIYFFEEAEVIVMAD